MSTRSKNSSSVLALAALGVYFGLLLAGAAPNTFAQVPGPRDPGTKGQRDATRGLDGDAALEQFAVTLEELYKIASEIACDADQTKGDPLSLNYFVSIKPNGAGRFYAPPPYTGDKGAWSGRYRQPLYDLYDAFLPRIDDWHEKMLVQFSVGPKDVSLRASIVTDPSMDAALQPNFEQALVRRRATATDFIRSQIYNSARVTVEKNKVIVIANLPRAGLDSLLVKDGK